MPVPVMLSIGMAIPRIDVLTLPLAIMPMIFIVLRTTTM